MNVPMIPKYVVKIEKEQCINFFDPGGLKVNKVYLINTFDGCLTLWEHPDCLGESRKSSFRMVTNASNLEMKDGRSCGNHISSISYCSSNVWEIINAKYTICAKTTWKSDADCAEDNCRNQSASVPGRRKDEVLKSASILFKHGKALGKDTKSGTSKTGRICPNGEIFCRRDAACVPINSFSNCKDTESEVTEENTAGKSNRTDSSWNQFSTENIIFTLAGITIFVILIAVAFKIFTKKKRKPSRDPNSGSPPSADLTLLLPPHPATPLRSQWAADTSVVCVSLLGKGSFGKVYQAEDLSAIVSPTGYAIKCIDMIQTIGFSDDDSTNVTNTVLTTTRTNVHLQKYVTLLLNEIQIMDQLTCDHVVRYYGCWAENRESSQLLLNKASLEKFIQGLLDNFGDAVSSATNGSGMSQIFIKMELCYTTLKHYLENWFIIGDEVSILKQVAAGLRYVHEKLFIHRDIKPGNIFCKVGPSGDLTWKIGDFGLAVKCKNGGNIGAAGTHLYQGPELRKHTNYTIKTDSYSLGLVGLEIIHSTRKSFNRFEVFTELRGLGDADRRRFLNVCSAGKFKNLAKIINKLRVVDAESRLCSRELYDLLELK
ncbi:putative serine/threonine-protein kinase GCN2 [Folsomia candida]|uniref:non-specific serine/threonine protein kinase n=1 Tax=Folsomia candida TaxID=158441 RepID=A0A226EY76_FOLCA|nr:putative serine/threonine-protein kinase GCN2 [Folsomia candida]